MDESDLRDRLERIERRQHLVLVVLVGIAYVIGFWTAGVLYAAFGLVAFVLVAVRRRRSRNAAGQ
ncbi:hypothetical protein BRD15_01115 [Halobacteriales archaeon SW_6_65_15]|nr:MAG: hypothetical protein BRD15_01115 [Halobacteriales archaeon SW_6_65_15]